MNKRQKRSIVNLIIVSTITMICVAGMSNLRDKINKSEETHELELIGQDVLDYRSRRGSLPPKSYLATVREKMKLVRLGPITYRAVWITYDAKEDTVLAYTYRHYKWFIKSGYLVLRLNGLVEWINKDEFEKLLATQQSQTEIDWLKEHH